jgi:2-oxoglutarate ferredoxin oxidoreductase subunit beta
LIEKSFDICKLVEGAGASYVARATTYHHQLLERLIMEGAENPGFSVIEAVTQCPTYYGRYNNLGTSTDMMQSFKNNAVNIEKVKSGAVELKNGQFTIGVLHKHTEPEYTESYFEVIKRAQQ